MIVVNVIIESTPDDIAALKDSVATLETHSRAEAGCYDHAFSVELNNPGVMRLTECWESEEALAAHMQASHMVDFQAAISAHASRRMKASYYRAEPYTPG